MTSIDYIEVISSGSRSITTFGLAGAAVSGDCLSVSVLAVDVLARVGEDTLSGFSDVTV